MVLSLAFASQVMASTTVSVSMTFTEPVAPAFKSGDCPVFPEGFCGSGEVIPFGHATEMVDFGAGCGGACDVRTINLVQGSIFIEETFNDGTCRGSCHPSPSFPNSGTLTDVIVGGTGSFAGATGELSGTVRVTAGVSQPIGQSQVKLSGSITLTP
jgi:hypothetical protein